MLDRNMEKLLKQYFDGDRRALARIISIIENGENNVARLMDKVYYRTGNAYRIGITGPPGAGKSTLVDQLTKIFRQEKKSVGIIAVDPTSPFTGGALLGDRIRMNDLTTDPGVFIRSMATRGSLGGLAHGIQEIADLLDAFGFEIVIFETVGVGQSELDIVEAADATVVVLVPESGDSIQAMKAGLMEIADIFVINKSDRDGADRTMMEIEYVLEFKEKPGAWKPPIIQTVANIGAGINFLNKSLSEFYDFQNKNHSRLKKQKKRINKYVRQLVKDKLLNDFWQPEQEEKLVEKVELILQKKHSPYAVSEKIIKDFRESQ